MPSGIVEERSFSAVSDVVRGNCGRGDEMPLLINIVITSHPRNESKHDQNLHVSHGLNSYYLLRHGLLIHSSALVPYVPPAFCTLRTDQFDFRCAIKRNYGENELWYDNLYSYIFFLMPPSSLTQVSL